MSIEILRKRYLHISNCTLSFLKNEGFKKKGLNYDQEREELFFGIYSAIPQTWMNSENSYAFIIGWKIFTQNSNYLDVYKYIENEKKITKATIAQNAIFLDNYITYTPYLHPDDLETVDDYFIDYFQSKIKNEIIPFFKSISYMDDMIKIAEKELLMEREERKYFRASVSKSLALLYASKNLKTKTLEMCDKSIELTPQTAKDLAIKRKKKYIKYFEEKGL